MESVNSKKDASVYYSPFKSEDKHYFGGFFNLADQNIQEVFGELKGRFRVSGNKLVEDLNAILPDNLSITDYERWVNIFSEYFPVAKYLDLKYTIQGPGKLQKELTRRERITYFRETFISILKAVSSFRHFYTHYHDSTVDISEGVFEFLDSALLSTSLMVKKNYLKTDNTKDFLKESLGTELGRLIDLKIKQLQKKKKEVEDKIGEQKKNGEKMDAPFKFSKDKDQISNSLFNDAFRNLLYENSQTGNVELSRMSKSRFDPKYVSTKDFDIPISQNGLVFLLSFFLSKKEITEFKKYLRGFKATVVPEQEDLENNSLRFMATHRVYSIHSFKGLKKRIQTSPEAIRETLLLQMIDELSKVPDCIYQHLSKDDQQKFIEDWNEFLKDWNGSSSRIDLETVKHPIIRKRYEDKFNYFALRFLDEFANFPTLRFQVHLGNYIHHNTSKEFANVISERTIQEKITVFGRLSEMSTAKANYFNESESDIDSSWEIFPNPGYLFPKEPSQDQKRQKDSGKIGIYLKLDSERVEEIEESKKRFNSGKRKPGKITKREIVEKIVSPGNQDAKPIVYLGEPLAYLSLNDIHSILYEFVNAKDKEKVGSKIENKIKGQIQKQISQIIQKDTSAKILKRYKEKQEGIEVNIEKIKKDLKDELTTLKKFAAEQEERRIDFNKTQNIKDYNPKRKHILHYSEKGKIAAWLSNDIKRFMPESFKSNWKGYQHSEFQRTLAYYETSKNEAIAILNNLDFNTFPFNIKKCFNKDYLHEFYETYLVHRTEYVRVLIEQIRQNQNDHKLLQKILKRCFLFLKEQNYRTHGLDKQVQHIMAHPVFIERGFMDRKPTMISCKSFADSKESFADWFVRYKECREYQNFYDELRWPIHIEVDSNSTKEDKENEKKIKLRKFRQQKNQQLKNDFYTLEMANDIYRHLFQNQMGVSLKNLFLTKEEREQRKVRAVTMGERDLSTIWNTSVSLKLFDDRLSITNIKLKDIGKVRNYEADKRIGVFLSYEPDKEWEAGLSSEGGNNNSLKVVDREIDNYEKLRSREILKEVQEMEKYIYDRVRDKGTLEQGGYPNFRKYILSGLLKKIKNVDVESFQFLNERDDLEKINPHEIYESKIRAEFLAYQIVYIRNKYAHNQMPKEEFFTVCKNDFPMKAFESYSHYFLEVFINAKRELLGL